MHFLYYNLRVTIQIQIVCLFVLFGFLFVCFVSINCICCFPLPTHPPPPANQTRSKVTLPAIQWDIIQCWEGVICRQGRVLVKLLLLALPTGAGSHFYYGLIVLYCAIIVIIVSIVLYCVIVFYCALLFKYYYIIL